MNDEIRKQIADAGLRYWEVVAEIGIHRVTFNDWLHFPLTGERLKRVQDAIKALTRKESTCNA